MKSYTGKIALVGVALADFLVRIAAELAFVAEMDFLPLVGIFVTRHGIDGTLWGWVLGWAFLSVLVYQLSPYFFPRKWLQKVDPAPSRTAIATATVLNGVAVEAIILESVWGASQSPVPFGHGFFPSPLLSVGLTTVLFAVGFPPLVATVGDSDLGTLRERIDPQLMRVDQNLSPDIQTVGPRGSLVVLLMGSLLAIVALLYPIPEILVLLVVAVDETLSAEILPLGPLGFHRDVAERFTTGAVVAWAGRQELFMIAGICLGLTTMVGPTSLEILSLVANGGFPPSFDHGVSLTSGLYYVTLLAMAAVHTLYYWARVIDRLPAYIFGASNVSFAPKGRLPLYLVPSGLLWSLASGWKTRAPEGLYLPPTVSESWAIRGLLAVLFALATIVYSYYRVQDVEQEQKVVPRALASLILARMFFFPVFASGSADVVAFPWLAATVLVCVVYILYYTPEIVSYLRDEPDQNTGFVFVSGLIVLGTWVAVLQILSTVVETGTPLAELPFGRYALGFLASVVAMLVVLGYVHDDTKSMTES